MSLLLDCPIRNSLFIYLFVAVGLLVVKPRSLFTEDGRVKPFGVGRKASLFNYPVVLLISSIIITFIFESIAR